MLDTLPCLVRKNRVSESISKDRRTTVLPKVPERVTAEASFYNTVVDGPRSLLEPALELDQPAYRGCLAIYPGPRGLGGGVKDIKLITDTRSDIVPHPSIIRNVMKGLLLKTFGFLV